MDNRQAITDAILTPELYFLITKFLAAGPLQETAKVLVRELENKKVLPKRIDWLGVEHEQTFAELEQKYAHIGANHLLDICCRIGPILDKELTPSVPGILSLLGAGRQNLLRTKEAIYRPRSQLDYCTRIHGVSLPDSALTKPVHNFQSVIIGREYGGPVQRKLLVPTGFYCKTKLLRRTVGHLSSVYCVLFDRTGRYIITGADDLLIKIWSAVDGRLLATLRGASAEITDIAINLDNTMLAAGSLDRILRVWDLQTTSPLAVLAGHTGMITSVNFCPSPRGDLKYLVTTSTDGSIAFWQYAALRGQKTTFAPKPIQYHEKLRPGQAQMMCTTFSPGGMFLAAGSADHHVRVYLMSEDGPKRILESETYTDAVDSMQWSHRGLRFISGSKDGTAHIWTFESQQWKNVKLSMTERLASCPPPEEGKKLKVTMVAWDCSDKYVITAVNDFTIKIWNSHTAKLHCVLRGHKDELYVLESNPRDEHVLLSAGHDGQVYLWDIETGTAVAHFVNNIDGQGHGGVFDAKWSPDGTMIAATDSHGHLLIYGLGIGPDKYKTLPNELFFHTDYRPLLRDASHHVVDEQTQIMPHLMPPPFLVDSDGNPHLARYQRFVPGREACSTDQLVPNLSVTANGVVIDDHSAPHAAGGAVPNGAGGAGGAGGAAHSHIDRLIAVLANRSGAGGAPASGGGGANTSQIDRMIEALANRQGQDLAPDSNIRAVAAAERGNLLGNGEVNDVAPAARQGTTWGRPVEQQLPAAVVPVSTASATMPFKYVRRIFVRPMKYAQLQQLKQSVYTAGQFEMQEYKREMRRRPIMINTANTVASSGLGGIGRPRNTRPNGTGSGRTARRRQGQTGGAAAGGSAGAVAPPAGAQPAYRTRAVRDQEELDAPRTTPAREDDDDYEESSGTSGDTSYSNVEENLDESSEDSDTDSSDYSDWVADRSGPNLEPPKRSKRKPLSRRRSPSDESSDDDATTTNTNEQATTSAAGAATTAQAGSRRNKRIVIPPRAANGEIPELYRPAEWLSEVIPRKAPYYPQMGDEVVYLRQGHLRYLDAVRTKKVYKPTNSAEPWKTRTLRDHELVRVIGIKYEIRPPRLCCLKLALVDEEGGQMTGTTFKIKYHDMPDVLDFLVLRQTYDLAVQRNWGLDDRFRCMIGDGWWMGQIESRLALDADFPDSTFMCFRVRWDNGEYEYMSPWDMEPIDEQRLPDEVGGAVPVLPEEIRATLYQPKSEEWHRGDRDGSCRRIINGLEQVMRLSIAEHFLAPVDLNIYPDYAYLIEYPIDLTTIKSRFENHFYRRITSAQFDVRYLATNAEKYNRSHTNIVKHARIITDLCLRIIRDPNDIDVAAVYHQLVDVYHSSESENDNESDVGPSTSTGPSTSAAAAARQSLNSTRRSNRIRSDGDWRSDCRQLLDIMWQRQDSLPFREPVDTIEFPDYLEIIATPMDLRTVKEDLLGGNYVDPLDFAKDVRLIFQNSKNYNTNKRSRIYSMTLRLSSFFETHIKTVVSNWKAARRRANKTNKGRGSSSASPAKRGGGAAAAGGTRRRQQARPMRRMHSSDDDDDDEDVRDAAQRARGNYRRGGGGGVAAPAAIAASGRNGLTRGAAAAAAASSNRVTSSSSSGAHRRHAVVEEASSLPPLVVPPTRSSRRQAASQELTPPRIAEEDDDEDEDDGSSAASSNDDDDDDDEEEDTSAAATSDDDSDSHDDDEDDDDDDDAKTRGRPKGTPKAKQLKPKLKKTPRKGVNDDDDDDDDSEESYKPDNDRRQQLKRSALKRKKQSSLKKQQKKEQQQQQSASKKRRHRLMDDNDDQDEEDDDQDDEDFSLSPQLKRRKRTQSGRGDSRTPRKSPTQADESTQDSLPKRRGRPMRATVPASGDEPSTSAAAAQRHRRTLLNGGGRRHAAENDHSYHLPVRNGGRVVPESDTDSRELAPATLARPTRASVKRAILDWARSSDVEEADEDEEDDAPQRQSEPANENTEQEDEEDDEDEEEEAEEILPTPTATPTKANGGVINNGPSTSGGVMRQLRMQRCSAATVAAADDDGSDDEPLASSQSSSNQLRLQSNNDRSRGASTSNSTATPAKRPSTALQLPRGRGARPHVVAISAATSEGTAGIASSYHMTRSHATSTTATYAATTTRIVTTSTAAATSAGAASDSATLPFAAHDHNYVGGPTAADRPSTSSAAIVRHTRRVLSRHQRNADELDISLDPLENSRLIAATMRVRRGAGVVATSTTTLTTTRTQVRRRGRSSRSQEALPPTIDEAHSEEDDEDTGATTCDGAAATTTDAGTAGDSSAQGSSSDESSATQSNGGNGTSAAPPNASEAASDSDDNQPLTSFVPAARRTAGRNTSGTPRKVGRPRRRSNVSFVCDEDDDDDEYSASRRRRQQHARKRRQQKQRNQHTLRRQLATAARRNAEDEYDDEADGSGRGSSRRMQRETRNQKRPRYNEQSDDEGSLERRRGGVVVTAASNRRRRREPPASEGDTNDIAAGSSTSAAAAYLANEEEDTDDDVPIHADGDEDEDEPVDSDEQLVSVSSRGRVRKITAKARGIFKE